MNRKLVYLFGIELSLFLVFLLFSQCNSTTPEQTNEQPPSTPTEAKVPPINLGAQQLLISLLPNDSTIQGTLFVFEKKEEEWVNPYPPFPVTVGKTGIAPGRGIHDDKLLAGTLKKEGDGKSPAGIFQLGTAFGYAKKRPEAVQHITYYPLDESTQCIEDTKSRQYNKIIDPTEVEKDFEQSDFMLRDDNLYKWGVFVEHNKEQAPSGGSCIFLHIWRAEDKPTAGCTAMSEENMFRLLQFLNESKNPLLVQLTEADYPAFQDRYLLPDLVTN
ncbi:MAG: L,D-transpeptidase family protein [Bacteroidota bacterium]